MRHLLTLLIATPLLAPLVLWCFPRRLVRAQQVYAVVASAFVFGLSLLLLRSSPVDGEGFLARFREQVPWIPSLGISWSVGVDGISLFLVLLTTLMTPVAILSSFRATEERVREYLAALLVLEAALVGTFVALDLFLFFVFWQLALLMMFVIIGLWGGPRRVYAAVKFFLFTLLGSGVMLLAVLYLAWQHAQVHAGQWTFDYFALRDIMLPYKTEMLLFAGFTLGLAIMAAVWPLHTWLPDVQVEAPTWGSVILAAVLLKVGAYGFLRFSMGLFPYATFRAGPTVAALAVTAILVGALLAWKQRDMKRLLAYMSVSHLGVVMLGLVSGDPRGIAGSVLQMVNHGICAGALLLLVGAIYERRQARRSEDFGGLASVMPVCAAVFLIAVLSSIGVPATGGFVGEFLVLFGAFQSEFLPLGRWLAAAAALGIVLSAVYMLGMYLRVFFGPVRRSENEKLPDLGVREKLCSAPLVVLVFAVGVLPGWFTERMAVSVREHCRYSTARILEMDEIRLAGGLDEAQSRQHRAGRVTTVTEAAERMGLISGDSAEPVRPRGHSGFSIRGVVAPSPQTRELSELSPSEAAETTRNRPGGTP